MSMVVGLTGGIGSGKTAVSDAFAALGVPVIDADIVAREVVAAGSPALANIVSHFGEHILTPSGELDRAALRARVFNNETEKAWLNNLTHPAIREQMLNQIAAADYPYCILAVPLLIENKLTAMCQRVLVVDCPEALQLERAMQRDGSDEELIKNIMRAQASRTQRKQCADDIIDNSGELSAIANQVALLHKQYLALSKAP